MLFGVSAWGWGRAVARLCGDVPPWGWAYQVALGLAALTALGGLLNLFGLASPAALWALLTAGWIFGAFAARKGRPPVAEPAWLLVTSCGSLSVLVFLTATLMPSAVFNIHDDFHTYMARPVSMLETGSLRGGWLDLIGADSFGAQAFLQGFLLLVFSPAHLNGFDGVFCAALAVALAGETARRMDVHMLFAVGAMSLVVLINPQTVNISAVFAGTVMIQGATLAVLRWSETLAQDTGRARAGAAVPIGLFLAAAVALKTTLAPFVVLFTLGWLGAGWSLAGHWRQRLGEAAVAAAAAAGAAIPWIALHGPRYTAALARLWEGGSADSDPGTGSPPGPWVLFSGELSRLAWGGTVFAYNWIFAAVLLGGLVALARLWAPGQDGARRFMVPLVAAGLPAAAIYLLQPYLLNPAASIRYACPALIAAAPWMLAGLGRSAGYRRKARQTAPPWRLSRLRGPGAALGLAAPLLVAWLFGDVLADRMTRAVNHRTLLSFAFGENYIRYNRDSLGPEVRAQVRVAQESTEPGTAILAWITRPFHLDFARNPVSVVSEPSLVTPWLSLPLESDTEAMRAHLVGLGYRYVMWELEGYGVKKDEKLRRYLALPYPRYRATARANLDLRKHLLQLEQHSRSVFRRNGLVIFDLQAAAPGRS